ncbi:MAG: futalosine hydrolase [Bacteroidales bacterium]|nr:futalosine hydrolase [Bacteroidales bacterium]
MSNIVLITAATSGEMECLDKLHGRLKKGIRKLVTGVGPVSTVYAIMSYLAGNDKPGMLINIGIAGSYRKDLNPGSVIVPLSDCFADLGICDGSSFIPLKRAGIDIHDDFTPSGSYYAHRAIVESTGSGLRTVKGITVSTATGSDAVREALASEYNPDIESMEGAASYYVCNKEGIPCVGIRAVSNMVGPRDKSSWDVNLALKNLSQAMDKYFKHILYENT